MSENLCTWKIVDSLATYNAIVTKDENALYFIEDVRQIYKGSKVFTEAYTIVTDFPETNVAQGKIYFHSTTLEGKVWNGTAYIRVIPPVLAAFDDSTTFDGTPTAEAIKTYANSKFTDLKNNDNTFVKSIAYDTANKAISVSRNGATETVVLKDQLVSADYDNATGKLTFTNGNGDSTTFNLPLEQFVKSGNYDDVTKNIVLVMQDNTTINIPAGDLVDITEFQNTDSVTVDNTVSNATKINVKLSEKAGNLLQILTGGDSGLYIAPIDISGKLDLVVGTAGNIIIAKADGQVETSTLKAGSSTLSGTPDANTLATEMAVSDIRSTLQTNIDTKVAKADIATGIRTSTTASDSKVASEKAVAAAIEGLAATYVAQSDIITGDLNTAAPSSSKIVSEATMVSALKWETVTGA